MDLIKVGSEVHYPETLKEADKMGFELMWGRIYSAKVWDQRVGWRHQVTQVLQFSESRDEYGNDMIMIAPSTVVSWFTFFWQVLRSDGRISVVAALQPCHACTVWGFNVVVNKHDQLQAAITNVWYCSSANALEVLYDSSVVFIVWSYYESCMAFLIVADG